MPIIPASRALCLEMALKSACARLRRRLRAHAPRDACSLFTAPQISKVLGLR